MGNLTFSSFNWLAIVVAAVAYFALGAIWYSKLLFVGPWIRLTGVKVDDPNAKKGLGQLMLASFVLMLIASLGLAVLLNLLAIHTWMAGAKLGLIAGVCFSSTAICVSYLYEKRPFALQVINCGYNTVGCVIAAVIIAVWK